MLDIPAADKKLRLRNVGLHSGGRTEYGTLYLEQHLLCFSFHPNTQKPDTSASKSHHGTPTVTPRPSNVGSVSGLSEADTISRSSTASFDSRGLDESSHSSNGMSRGNTSQRDGSEATLQDARRRQRPKEIWVPYSMISHCTLRPGHSAAQPARGNGNGNITSAPQDDEDLFPPTFGTSSYGRPSTDSVGLVPPPSSPPRSNSPVGSSMNSVISASSGRQPAIRLRCKDFKMMALHFHETEAEPSSEDIARQVFYTLRDRCCVDRVDDLHAFHFDLPSEELEIPQIDYDARREFARMGIGAKAAEGPGSAWRISHINRDYSYSATYPNILCVPRAVSDNMLKYGGSFRSRARIPALTYLHSNGGSITRSSQPMVGLQSKRNPQDERLVTAIFSSHTPPLLSSDEETAQVLTSPSTTLEESSSDPSFLEVGGPGLPVSHSDTALDQKVDEKATALSKKVYGSTRRNLIIDARPKINAQANRATGGGIEDVANYMDNGEVALDKAFLNIANIHVMRASLEKVVESFANSDYIKMKPNQEALRKSGWLGHISGLLAGSETVARVVGLGGSHVLVHCSDGWDRTAQVAALAEIMLDPHYRTIEGFITLIQKDFLSFGHKFRDRNGIEGSEKWFEIENERIVPPRNRENSHADPNSLNALGNKALSGARNWFSKNHSNLFRQPNTTETHDTSAPTSRPASPPPNPTLHSPPTVSTAKEETPHVRTSEKEIAPIFHQFLDAVYQLLHHHPAAFEFNEYFLRRLYYHTYACHYGEFLFNNERERSAAHTTTNITSSTPTNYNPTTKPPHPPGSVWRHLLSQRPKFTNPSYAPSATDPLLFPLRNTSPADRDVQVRWWSALFGRDDAEMNVPRALAPADPAPPPPAGVEKAAKAAAEAEAESEARDGTEAETPRGEAAVAGGDAGLKPAKSTPSFGAALSESLSSGFASLSTAASAARRGSVQREAAVRGEEEKEGGSGGGSGSELERAFAPADADVGADARGAGTSASAARTEALPTRQTEVASADRETGLSSRATEAESKAEVEVDQGDPLGVSAAAPTALPAAKGGRGGIDFAAFAAQNGFRE